MDQSNAYESDYDRLAIEQACEWFVRLHAGDSHDNAAFLRWLKESPINVREIMAAALIHELLLSRKTH